MNNHWSARSAPSIERAGPKIVSVNGGRRRFILFIGGWANAAASMRSDLDNSSDPFRDADFTRLHCGLQGLPVSVALRRARE
jgi:hypothetical protein